MDTGEAVSKASDLRQGDVIHLPQIPSLDEGELGWRETHLGVVILSQTCDLVQDSKSHVTIAPLINPDPNLLSAAHKGKSPLHLYLAGFGDSEDAIADMQRMFAIPKQLVVGRNFLARYVRHESGDVARVLAARIGRVFTRFPFPDEVNPAFAKIRDKAQNSAGTQSAFGKVIDLIEDLRVSADQWESPGRHLKLHVVVPERFLISPDDVDVDWEWSNAIVSRKRTNERLESASLTRISELVVANCNALLTDPDSVDTTTIFYLWGAWQDKVQIELLSPGVSHEIASFTVDLLSDVEFSFAQWRKTESLDLEVLSDSSLDK